MGKSLEKSRNQEIREEIRRNLDIAGNREFVIRNLEITITLHVRVQRVALVEAGVLSSCLRATKVRYIPFCH